MNSLHVNGTEKKKEVIDELFLPGEEAILNDDFARGEVVRVVRQTPKRLYTTVERYGQQWDIMTYKLSKPTNEQLREWDQDYKRDF